jgi:hypothetical protein
VTHTVPAARAASDDTFSQPPRLLEFRPIVAGSIPPGDRQTGAGSNPREAIQPLQTARGCCIDFDCAAFSDGRRNLQDSAQTVTVGREHKKPRSLKVEPVVHASAVSLLGGSASRRQGRRLLPILPGFGGWHLFRFFGSFCTRRVSFVLFG